MVAGGEGPEVQRVRLLPDVCEPRLPGKVCLQISKTPFPVSSCQPLPQPRNFCLVSPDVKLAVATSPDPQPSLVLGSTEA